MGQGLSRKRSGTATITATDKGDTPGANSNGDVVKTEANGTAVQTGQATDSPNSEQEAQTDGGSGKKEKKKKRFIFSLKRSRPGSGRKKKAKKEKSNSQDTSTNSGKSNRSSLFMDEFQIPEDDGIDSVSLSSNEDKENKKRKDSGVVIRRSKRGSRSSKNGKKGKKKKQKTEKKKDEKCKKKNSKEEDKTVESVAAADGTLNVNQSVEPLHASVAVAKDEAKVTAVSETLPEPETKMASETKESAKPETEKNCEDDLVAAVTAVMDSRANEDRSGCKTSKGNEDDEIKRETVVKDETILLTEVTIQEAAVTSEEIATFESTPLPISQDSHDSPDEAVSPPLSVESGTPKRVSLGPRLKTAILKKYSGAGDTAPESQRVTLTKPKIVDVPDLVPPPRKNRARRLLSQKTSNASIGDPNTSTTSSTEPSSPGRVTNSVLDTRTFSDDESSNPRIEGSDLLVKSFNEAEIVKAEVADKKGLLVPSPSCSDAEMHSHDDTGTEPSQVKVIDEHVDVNVNANNKDLRTERESLADVSTPLLKNMDADMDTVKTQAVETIHDITSVEKFEDREPEYHIVNELDNVSEGKSAENVSCSDPVVDEPGIGFSLAQQAKMVVEQVINRTTNSFSGSVPKEDISENVSEATPGPLVSEKTSFNVKGDVAGTEKITLNEESMVCVETSKDNDECILKEVEIIVVATKTYDTELETDTPVEKTEPIVIIERVHVEPYFGPELEEEAESNVSSTDSATDNTTITSTTNSEALVKRQKYSKETGEVCKECLCEEGTTKLSRETNTEPTVSNVESEMNKSDTGVKNTAESDSCRSETSENQGEQKDMVEETTKLSRETNAEPTVSNAENEMNKSDTGVKNTAESDSCRSEKSENQGEQKDMVEGSKEDHDDSFSNTTSSTVVDDGDQENTLVEESDSLVNTKEETPDTLDTPKDEKGDEKHLVQEKEVEISVCVSTETVKTVGDECNNATETAMTCDDKLSLPNETRETVGVKLGEEQDTSCQSNEIDISDNNNCKDAISPVQGTVVQVADNSTDEVRTDKPTSTATGSQPPSSE